MVPYCVLGKSLGFFFVKYLFVSAVFGWDFGCGGVIVVRWGEGDSSDIYFVGHRFSWYSASSRSKYSLYCVWGLEDYGELGVVYPSSFPIDFWLSGCEPGVS